jgi:hypothetical protein
VDKARESAAIAADSSRVSMMFCWDYDFSVVVADFFDQQYSLRVLPLIYGWQIHARVRQNMPHFSGTQNCGTCQWTNCLVFVGYARTLI